MVLCRVLLFPPLLSLSPPSFFLFSRTPSLTLPLPSHSLLHTTFLTSLPSSHPSLPHSLSSSHPSLPHSLSSSHPSLPHIPPSLTSLPSSHPSLTSLPPSYPSLPHSLPPSLPHIPPFLTSLPPSHPLSLTGWKTCAQSMMIFRRAVVS